MKLRCEWATGQGEARQGKARQVPRPSSCAPRRRRGAKRQHEKRLVLRQVGCCSCFVGSTVGRGLGLGILEPVRGQMTPHQASTRSPALATACCCVVVVHCQFCPQPHFLQAFFQCLIGTKKGPAVTSSTVLYCTVQSVSQYPPPTWSSSPPVGSAVSTFASINKYNLIQYYLYSE